MGVKGLWDIVSPSGIRVKPETLEGQILAIDASIWLKQFLMGLKDKEGKTPQGAHLLGFFKRLCKLLYYGILPVVVFDGPPPDIKRRTLELRRMQREMSEVNVRRVANKLLLNTIRLRTARRIRDRIKRGGQECEEASAGELVVLEEECGVERESAVGGRDLVVEDEVSRTPNLFSSSSSEDEDAISGEGVVSGRSLCKFKKFGGRYRVAEVAGEMEENLEGGGATSYFPVMGFLSERRRLDEMPEIDTNLFAMPVLVGSSGKLGSKRMTRIEDLNAFLRSSEAGSGERRLMDLPLDTEIDPQVFDQLSSKLQYEILVQLRDAWMNALRSNAVETKDNMSRFSNSQIECYLRYLRINQEIERLKVKMAKECEEQQMDSERDEMEFVEYGEVYDPDDPGNEKDLVQPSSCGAHEDESTLTGRIISFAKKSAVDAGQGGFGDEILSMKGYGYLSRIKKKERIRFLQSTNYARNEGVVSNPLNTPLFELEKLLSVEACREPPIKKDSRDCFSEFDNAERVKLLREDVKELFNVGSGSIIKDDKDGGARLAAGVNKGAFFRENEDDKDWEDIEWESVAAIDHQEQGHSESKALVKNILLFANDIESSVLDSILNKEEDTVAETASAVEAGDKEEDTVAETASAVEAGDKEEDTVAETASAVEAGDKEDTVAETASAVEVGDKEEDTVAETASAVEAGDKEGPVYDGSLDEILLGLEREQEELSLEFGRHEALLGAEVTREMQFQVCQLLAALGVPWVDSPGEAEAQASALTWRNKCHGVLSEDSDCFLFGARRIFRNFFSGSSIEMYDLDAVKRFLGIQKQEQFYILAILLGCDYALGVNGIGPVNAVEVLKAYPDLEDMSLFRDWSMNKFEDQSSHQTLDTPERAEFKRNHYNYRHSWVFPPDFPCPDAIHAMRSPTTIPDVNLVFGKVDRDSTVELMASNTGLTRERIASIIDPIISRQRRQQDESKQTKIDGFLVTVRRDKRSSYCCDQEDCRRDTTTTTNNNPEERVASIVSKRMKKALSKAPPQVK